MLASRLSKARSPVIRPMVLRREFPKCTSGACILVLCNKGSFVFGCLHIYLEERGWQSSLETLAHLVFLFPFLFLKDRNDELDRGMNGSR
jgi:hypothetical protein